MEVLATFDAKNRAEYFFVTDCHINCNFIKDCRSDEVTVFIARDLNITTVKNKLCTFVNTLLNISIEQIYQIVGNSEPTVIDRAEADAVEELMPSLLKYLVLGAMFGAILVCAMIAVLTMMNTSLKTSEDVEYYLQLPVLSAVPYYTERIPAEHKKSAT